MGIFLSSLSSLFWGTTGVLASKGMEKMERIEPLVATSSMGFYAGLLLFAYIALPVVWKAERLPEAQKA